MRCNDYSIQVSKTYSNSFVITDILIYYIYMKVVGNKRQNASKWPFLRYSTGGSGMISAFIFCKQFVKILFWCREISLFPLSEPRKFPGNFPEFSRIFRKFPRNFAEISRTSWTFPGNFPDISWKFRETSRKLPRKFPGTSRKCPGNFPEISQKKK